MLRALVRRESNEKASVRVSTKYMHIAHITSPPYHPSPLPPLTLIVVPIIKSLINISLIKHIKFQLFEETYFQDFQQLPHMLQHMPAGATPPTQAYSQVTPQVGTETRPLFA